MNTITIDKLTVSGEIALKKILDINMLAMVNEHAILELYGLIDFTGDNELNEMSGKKMILEYNTDEDRVTVFAGKIYSAGICFRGKECHLKIKCLSASTEFDKIKYQRSFQDVHMTYRDVLNAITFKGTSILTVSGENREIEKPIIQYEETDWEFCKRIAGKFCSIVIPEITSFYPQIAVGLIVGKEYVLKDRNSYQIIQDFEEYRRKRKFCECCVNDFTVYLVSGEDNYMLGDQVTFMEEQKIVLAKRIYLNKSHTEIEYTLGTERSMGIQPFNNRKICGLSLEGVVHWREEEKIKVKLDIDKNRKIDLEQLYAYDYVPVSGNIMYAVPEKGSTVRLYFPDGNEANGFVTESLCENIQYPTDATKVLETKESKKLELTPESMTFRSTDGPMVNLHDHRGAEVSSDKNIYFSAKKNIRLRTDGMVTCDTPLGYHFEDYKSKHYIDIAGNEILLKTARAVMSGLPHKLRDRPVLAGLDTGVGNPLQYASAILGCIPQGIAKTATVAAILGAIPTYTNPSFPYDLSDLISLGQNMR